jgi:hypothetical protein
MVVDDQHAHSLSSLGVAFSLLQRIKDASRALLRHVSIRSPDDLSVNVGVRLSMDE